MNTKLDDNISAFRKHQLEILIELDTICKKYNLRYYLAYGTCLGAIRHKGFIPWDSDIDVLMPIEDVKKLSTLQSKLPVNYFLQSYKTDPQFQCISYRLRKSNTTCIEKEYVGLNINHGIYIDIYPYYNCPKGKIKYHWFILQSYLYRVLVANRIPYNHGIFMKIATQFLLCFYDEKRRKKRIEIIEERLQSVSAGNGILDYFGEDITFTSAIVYDNAWFAEPQPLIFEGREFNGPTDPKAYLKKRYGDYMQLPSIEKRKEKLSYVYIDTNKGYLEHRDIWDKNKNFV